jgi:hypothetical protein
MAPPTFIQESRLGRVIYQIRDGALYISVSKFGRGFEEHRVDLRRLSPDYKPLTFRLNFVLGLVGGFLVLCCLALWGLHRQTLIPEGAVGWLMHWPIYGIAFSLIAAVRFSRRFECFQFFDNWDKPALVIIREPAQAQECEAFVLALVSHIELARSNLPAAEREAVLRQLERESAGLPAAGQDLAYWKLSLVFGGLAVGIPWVPGLAYYFDLLHFMLVFWLCVGGAACCVFSYQKKESGRHWSVLGLLLSLIPPFFY